MQRQIAKPFLNLSEYFECENVVIGAGVIGLSIGQHLSHHPSSQHTLILEKNNTYGEEISSRNSEVIHAGLYYPIHSLKTKLCVEGNSKLYALCQKYGIPYRKCGKWIVAQNDEEAQYLETNILQKAKQIQHLYQQEFSSLKNLKMISQDYMKKLEPNVKAMVAIQSPESGIIDSHKLMQLYVSLLEQTGKANLVSRTQVLEIYFDEPYFYLRCQSFQRDATLSEISWIKCKNIINSAGLYSSEIANLLQHTKKESKELELHFWKGTYIGYRSSPTNPIATRLIYPVPEKNIVGLGTHLTIDLQNHIRFGPDAEYVGSSKNYPKINEANSKFSDYQFDYKVYPNKLDEFYRYVKQYLPTIERDRMYEEYAGIRPKLQKPGDAQKDFQIELKQLASQNKFVNCIGMESPGLTASPAIGEYVTQMIYPKE